MKKLLYCLCIAIAAASCSSTHFYYAYAPNTPLTVRDSNDSLLLQVQVAKGRFGISNKYLTDTCYVTIGAQTFTINK